MQVFCVTLLLVLEIYYTTGLTCQTVDERRGEELKKIYTNCLKRYDGRNSSERKYSDENSSKEKRRVTKPQWDRRDSFGNRDDYAGTGGDWSMGRGRDRMSSRDEWSNNREERLPSRHERLDGNGDRRQMDGMGQRSYGTDDYNYNEDPSMQRYNNNYGGTQQSRRNKREKTSRNKSKPRTTDDSYRNSDRSSTENRTKDEGAKACALHCFMDELDMTAEDGLPDKYLVTKVITKDLESGDLKDFLQESIDECFQMLYNENIQDKCEFSHHILTCLSDKGKANCDDWKDEASFK